MSNKRFLAVFAVLMVAVMLVAAGCSTTPAGNDSTPTVVPTSSPNDDASKSPSPLTTELPVNTDGLGGRNDGGNYKEETPDQPIVIEIPSVTAKAGEQFTIPVTISGTEGWTWSSFEFGITYDPAVFKIIEIKSTELTKAMISMSKINEDDNIAKIAYITAEDMTGGGTIIEIVCEAVAAGTFNVSISNQYMYRCVTEIDSGKVTTVEIPLQLNMGTVTVTAA